MLTYGTLCLYGPSSWLPNYLLLPVTQSFVFEWVTPSQDHWRVGKGNSCQHPTVQSCLFGLLCCHSLTCMFVFCLVALWTKNHLILLSVADPKLVTFLIHSPYLLSTYYVISSRHLWITQFLMLWSCLVEDTNIKKKEKSKPIAK